MPAAIPIVMAVVATTSAVMQNQQIQHAKGAAQAQETATQNALKDQQVKDKQTQDAKAAQGSATQSAAISAIRASMSSAGGMGGTILTSPTNSTTPAPTMTKTLLGA